MRFATPSLHRSNGQQVHSCLECKPVLWKGQKRAVVNEVRRVRVETGGLRRTTLVLAVLVAPSGRREACVLEQSMPMLVCATRYLSMGGGVWPNQKMLLERHP